MTIPYAGTPLEKFYTRREYPGKLISFEGIDGAGKTTQMRRLAQHYRSQGITVRPMREPGGTILGDEVRRLLLDPSSHICDLAEMMLFFASRAQIMHEEILPSLEKGEHVFLDRFIDSTIAYQGAGRFMCDETLLGHIESINGLVTLGHKPDVTFYLHIDQKTAKARSPHKNDRMEQSGEEFYTRVFRMYESLARTENRRIVTVDAKRTEDAVFSDLQAKLDVVLGVKQ